mmetsp:Transcript_43026/g.132569  ORF Transcript_43026/g.132569 Transcript_43026/m.132569 type:complete len:279 (-) Transcript_43026:856-1692(-)
MVHGDAERVPVLRKAEHEQPRPRERDCGNDAGADTQPLRRVGGGAHRRGGALLAAALPALSARRVRVDELVRSGHMHHAAQRVDVQHDAAGGLLLLELLRAGGREGRGGGAARKLRGVGHAVRGGPLGGRLPQLDDGSDAHGAQRLERERRGGVAGRAERSLDTLGRRAGLLSLLLVALVAVLEGGCPRTRDAPPLAEEARGERQQRRALGAGARGQAGDSSRLRHPVGGLRLGRLGEGVVAQLQLQRPLAAAAGAARHEGEHRLAGRQERTRVLRRV